MGKFVHGLVLYLLLLFLAFWIYTFVQQYKAVQGARPTAFQIISAKIHINKDKTGYLDASGRCSSGPRHALLEIKQLLVDGTPLIDVDERACEIAQYVPKVKYLYKVKGQEYSGNAIIPPV